MRKRVLSLFLVLAMLMSMVPAYAVGTGADTKGEILSFDALEQEEYTASLGTVQEDIGLPENLTATVNEPVTTVTGTEEGKAITSVHTEERELQIPVTWSCEDYQLANEGSYTFTARAEGYTLAAGVTWPTVTVTLEHRLANPASASLLAEEKGAVLYVSSKGTSSGAGTRSDPMELNTAIRTLNTAGGGTIYVMDDLQHQRTMTQGGVPTISANVRLTTDPQAGGVSTIWTTGNGAFAVVGKGAVLTLGNLIVDGGGQGSHAMFIIGTTTDTDVGHMVLEDGAVIRNCKTGFGVVWTNMNSDTSVTIKEGAVISGNTADGGSGTLNPSCGGGVTLRGGKLTMEGGKITGNTAKNSGGGVYVGAGATFIMNGGQISGNTAAVAGGGVSMYGKEFTMGPSARITNNRTTATGSWQGGGGVDLRGGESTLAGEISGNTGGKDGGGVLFFSSDAKASISGRVVGNTATNGGGVYIVRGSATLDGATVIGNKSREYGAGVFLYEKDTYTCDLTLKGKTTILNNVSYYETAPEENNLLLFSSEKARHTVTLDGLVSGSRIGVSHQVPNTWMTMEGDFSVQAKLNPTELNQLQGCFTSDNPGFQVGQRIDAATVSGHLTLVRNEGYYVSPTKGKDSNNGTREYPYQTLAAAITAASGKAATIHVMEDMTEEIAKGAEAPGLSTSGTLTITTDPELGRNATVTLLGDGGLYVSNGSLTLRNIVFDGAKRGNTVNNTSTVVGPFGVLQGTLTLDAGAVVQNFTANTPAVYELEYPNIPRSIGIKAGAKIAGNTMIKSSTTIFTGQYSVQPSAYGGGVGVCAAGGKLLMSGGAISGNTADYGGGVYLGDGVTFEMTGGEITNNTATYGSAVYMAGGSFTMGADAAITGNQTNQTDPESYDGTVTIMGGTATLAGQISDNEAVDGAGVLVRGGNVTLGGSVTNNRSMWGAVYLYGGETTMKDVTVTGNGTLKSGNQGYGVRLREYDGASLTLSGKVTVTDNATQNLVVYSGKAIQLNSLDTDSKIGVGILSGSALIAGEFAAGVGAANWKDCFISESPSFQVLGGEDTLSLGYARNNYYVSSTGSDTDGDGTPEKPFATVRHALTKAGADEPAVIHIMDEVTVSNNWISVTGNRTVTLTGTGPDGVPYPKAALVGSGTLGSNNMYGMIYVENSTLNMDHLTLKGGADHNTRAIRADGASVLNLNDGTVITGWNTTPAGQVGAIYSNGTICFSGNVRITGNAIGGMWLTNTVKVTLSGSPVITGNTKQGEPGTPYNLMRGGASIVVDGVLLPGAQVGITEADAEVNDVTFASADPANAIFLTHDGGQFEVAARDGQLYWSAKQPVARIGSRTYETLAAAMAAVENDQTIEILRDFSLTTGAVLTGKTGVKLTSADGGPYTIRRNINAANGLEFIRMTGGSTLTMSNLTLDGSKGMDTKSAQAFQLMGDSSLTLDSGAVIQNFYWAGSGSGTVYLEGCSLTMNEGAVIQNNTATYGAAVTLYHSIAIDSSFTMNGGTITGNHSLGRSGYNEDPAFGAVHVGRGVFTMNGGTITGNTGDGAAMEEQYRNAGHGSGISIYGNNDARVVLSGNAVVENNTFTTADGRTVADNIYIGHKDQDKAAPSGTVNLSGSFTGKVGVALSASIKDAGGVGGNAAGYAFGTAAAGSTGARNIVNDVNGKLSGVLDGSTLKWGASVARTSNDGGRSWTEYPTLQDAVDAVDTDKSTASLVELLTNVTLTQTVTVTGSKAFTLRSNSEESATYTILRGKTNFYLMRVGDGADVTFTNIILDGNKGKFPASNTSTAYSGLLDVAGGSATLEDGAILQNNAGGRNYNYSTAGAVRVIGGGTLTMEDGAVIRGNTADRYGSAIQLGNNGQQGHLVMHGGSITGNATTNDQTGWDYGGTVCAWNGSVTMTGGIITGNTVSHTTANSGGSSAGVMVNKNVPFYVSGNAVITGNTITNSKYQTSNGNVHLHSGAKITLNGAFTGSIGVTEEAAAGNKAGSEFGTAIENAAGAGNFFNDVDGALMGTVEEGILKWADGAVARTSNDGGKRWTEYPTLQDAVDAVDADGNTDSIVELLRDVTLTQTVTTNRKAFTLRSDSRVDNVYTIKRGSDSAHMVQVTDGGDVTITDLVLDGGAVWTGAADPVLGRGKTNVGMKTGGYLLYIGGGSVTLDAGAVIQNNDRTGVNTGYTTSADRGGAVSIQGSGSTLTMKDGSVIRDSASNGGIGDGGAVAVWTGNTFLMEGGLITGCFGGRWGAVRNSGSMTMTGGRITGNLGGQDDGGVFHHGSGKLTISSGAVIEGNYLTSGIQANLCQYTAAVGENAIILGGNFTGRVGVTQYKSIPDANQAGTQFGVAGEAGYTGAGNFFNDVDGTLMGVLDGTVLKWGAPVARTSNDGGRSWTEYPTLQDAVDAVDTDESTASFVELLRDVTQTQTVTANSKAFTLRSNSEESATYTLSRGDTFLLHMLVLNASKVKVENLILDGKVVQLKNSGYTIVYAGGGSELTLSDGAVVQNQKGVKTNSNTNSAVYVAGSTLFVEDGAVLRWNQGEYGAAITLKNSTGYMIGGEIYGNYATRDNSTYGSSGAVDIWTSTLYMSGGRIYGNGAVASNNTQKDAVGGVCMETDGFLVLSGDAEIVDNYICDNQNLTSGVYTSGTPANVHIRGGGNGDEIQLNGIFTGRVGITQNEAINDANQAGAQFGTAEAGSTGAGSFFNDVNGALMGTMERTETGNILKWADGAVARTSNDGGKSWNEYATLQEALDAVDGSEKTDSYVELLRNLTAETTAVTGGKTFTLRSGTRDGDGQYMLKRGAGFTGSLLQVSANAQMTLTGLILDGNRGENANGTVVMVNVAGGGALTLGSGAVLQNNFNKAGSYTAGAVYGQPDSTININDGSVLRWNEAQYGAAVTTQGGTIHMTGGEIYGNYANRVSASNGGAGAMSAWGGGTINLSGGSITGNGAAQSAGGIVIDGAEVNISGAVVVKDNFITSDKNPTLTGGRYESGTQANLRVSPTGKPAENTLKLAGDFTGSVGVTQNSEGAAAVEKANAAGGIFGENIENHTGAKHFFNDVNDRLVGRTVDGKLVWEESGVARTSNDGGKTWTLYPTLQAAVYAVEVGDTTPGENIVELLQNTTEEEINRKGNYVFTLRSSTRTEEAGQRFTVTLSKDYVQGGGASTDLFELNGCTVTMENIILDGDGAARKENGKSVSRLLSLKAGTKLTLKNVTTSGNYGGRAVYVDSSSTLDLSGSVYIADNYAGDDLWLSNDSRLTLSGALSGHVSVTDGWSGATNEAGEQFGLAPAGASGAEHFVNAKNPSLVGEIRDGKLVWKDAGAVARVNNGENGAWVEYPTLTGAVASLENGGDTVELLRNVTENKTIASDKSFTLRSSTKEADQGKTYIIERGSTVAMFELTGGTVRLENIILDGNRDQLSTSARALISATGGTDLTLGNGATLRDSDGGQSYAGSSAGAVRILGGSLTLEEGALIQNCVSGDYGGAILVHQNAAFYMKGGAIKDNQTVRAAQTGSAYGGAVYVWDGTMVMTGGEITGNTADLSTKYLGGGVYVYSGTLEMSGGSITGNRAPNGAGVALGKTARMTLSGGAQITGNTNAGNAASNLYLMGQSSLTVSGTLTGKVGIADAWSSAQNVAGEVFGIGIDAAGLEGLTNDVNSALYAVLENGMVKWANEQVAKIMGGRDNGKTYATLAAAIADYDGDASYILMIANSEEEPIAVDRTVYVDLAGFTVTADVKVGSGMVFYGFDTTTNGYDAAAETDFGHIIGTVSGGGHMASTTSTGKEQTAEPMRYVTTVDGTDTSFHRFDMKLGTVVFRPSAAGIYFKSEFYGDTWVKNEIQNNKDLTYGLFLGLTGDTQPNAGNAAAHAPDSFQIGAAGDKHQGSMIQNIVIEGYADNADRTNTPIYVSTYFNFEEAGIVADAMKSVTLTKVVELTAKQYNAGTLTEAQKRDFEAFWEKYKYLYPNITVNIPEKPKQDEQ